MKKVLVKFFYRFLGRRVRRVPEGEYISVVKSVERRGNVIAVEFNMKEKERQ